MRNYKAIIPLIFIIFLDSLGFFIAIPVLVRLLMQPTTSLLPSTVSAFTRQLLYGFILALSPIAALITGPMIGRLSDIWGRKKTMLLSLGLSSLNYLFTMIGIMTGRLSFILLGRCFNGSASTSQPIAQAAVTDISAQQHKAMGLSIITVAMVLGMIIGPLLGALLSDSTLSTWFGNTTPFLFGLLLSIINFLLLFLFFHETYHSSQKPLLRSTFRAWLDVFKIKSIQIFIYLIFLTQFGWSLYYQVIPLYMQKSVTEMGVFLSEIGIWMILGLIVIYPLFIRQIKLAHGILICLILNSAALLIYPYLPTLSNQTLLIIPFSITAGMIYPSLLTIGSNQLANNQQGWFMGIAGAALGLAWLLSGELVGIIHYYSAHLAFYISACSYGFGFLLFLFYVLKRHNFASLQMQRK